MVNFKYTYEVCNCKKVSLSEILHAIKENNGKTIENIGKITDAGTICGCCKSFEDDFRVPKMEIYIEQILKKFA
jgi:NAD(P)H-nitrite reductase large subunit